MASQDMDSTDWFGPDTATFGDRLAAARENAQMSQNQLAKRLGVRVTTLRGWEEDRAEPRANRLSMMAGLLNVSLMWLINGEGEGLDGPEPEAISPDLASLLAEIRDMRAEMRAGADRLGRLEKKLRIALQEGT